MPETWLGEIVKIQFIVGLNNFQKCDTFYYIYIYSTYYMSQSVIWRNVS